MSDMIENQYVPDFVTPPGDTLLETLETIGMTQAELAERTGRPIKTISEIINGKAAITTETALQFEKVLGTPARFWINRERYYQEWKARSSERETLQESVTWLDQFPIQEMCRLGWMSTHNDKVSQLIETLSFFGIAAPEQWEPVWLEAHVAFRRSQAFQTHPGVISAWLRKGEIDAQKIQCASYDSTRFREALTHIRALTTLDPEEFVPAMQNLCAEAGVAMVFVHELPRLRTSGATRWITPNKALIQLSLLYKRDDQLWFTFFHEAGHILLHGKRDIFLEDDDGTDVKEAEADNFSANFLIPPGEYKKLKPRTGHFSEAEILAFAEKLGIAPGIVVGRLQHDQRLPITHLNGLKRRLIWAGE